MNTGQPTNVDDAALVSALRGGDESASARLVERYWPAIFRYCASYLNDEGLAEDVTQGTFAKLAATDDPPQGEIRPWLYKVARNHCLDILRRQDRSPTHNRPFRTGIDVARQSAGPRTRVAENERQAKLREIISAMPEDYRSVLLLKHIEGLSRGQIAEALGVSEPTVKGRLVRASEYLRDELRKHSGLSP